MNVPRALMVYGLCLFILILVFLQQPQAQTVIVFGLGACCGMLLALAHFTGNLPS
jgi:hypothetical protein